MITVITHDQAWELAQLGVPLFCRRDSTKHWRTSTLPGVAAMGLPRPEWMLEVEHYGVQVDE